MKRLGYTILFFLFVSAMVAAAVSSAASPQRSTFSTDFSTPDFLGSPPTGNPASPQCSFPVAGSWDVFIEETDYFDEASGLLRKAILRVSIEGTLSNPLNGKSVPDSYHSDMIKIYFAPDGSVTGSFENESRDDSYLHMAGHFVSDADGTIIKDVGRDFLPQNRHPMDVTPLCEVLS